MKNSECVKVAIRCRPLSSQEEIDQRKVIAHIFPERGEVILANPKADNTQEDKTFSFDIALQPKVSQDIVYQQTALPIVESVLEGYNGTIFAYGQTGTGKTFTMEGSSDSPNLRGIIPRTFEHVFKVIEGTPDKQFLVRASFLELYNEEIRDLLSKNYKNRLELREKPESGVYVKDLSSFDISSTEQLNEKLITGRKNRAVGETRMNQDSSRSHSLFMITVEMCEIFQDGQSHIRVGKLNLVDLAGSERQSKTQATGDRFKEAININQSLSTLGNVISALVDQKTTHVPYRDSKLTRLLQDSLGGNTKTVMIANIGPADYNYDETLSTLRYASRAKNIKNKPKINEDPKDAIIRSYQEELNKLKDELAKKMGGNVNEDGTITKVIEVEKIVKVQDEEQIKQIQDKLNQEKEEINLKYLEERKQIEEEINMAQDQKEKLLMELEQKEQREQAIQQDQEQLLNQIKQMEDKLLQGNKLKEQQRKQEKDLIKARMELEEQQQKERRLAEELKKRQAVEENLQDKYQNITQEIEQKTKKLNSILNKIKEAKQQKEDIQEYRLREKEELLKQNRELLKELNLVNLIIQHFIPQDEVQNFEKKLEYSEETEDWKLKDNVDENQSRLKRPGSAFGFKKPLCEYARMEIGFQSQNPRFKLDNILQLDLDLPERTTEDFDGQISQKLQETINIGLNEDEEEMQQIYKEKLPNVYIENPEQISKENVINNQTQKRLKSAVKKPTKRPQSGMKKY